MSKTTTEIFELQEAYGEEMYWEGKKAEVEDLIRHMTIKERLNFIRLCEKYNADEVAEYANDLPF